VPQIVPVCTVEDVRAEFRRRGISISEWARRRGLSAQLTYQILAGRKVGLRGQSHEISVLLGLKPGVVGSAAELSFVHEPQPGISALYAEEVPRQPQPA
jgi:gp16 family phage-associated protein